MTAPVLNDLGQQQLTIVLSCPTSISRDGPSAKRPSGQDREVPARKVAAVVFKGNATPRAIARQRAALLEWLEQRRLETIGSIELARYNPPFIPEFSNATNYGSN